MSVAIVLLAIVGLSILAIITDPDERIRQEALRRHPSQWSPDTEAAIEQAVALIDDGKALVREAEDYLKRRVSDA